MIPKQQISDEVGNEHDLRRPPSTPLPSTDWLATGLDRLLAEKDRARQPLRVIARAENVHTSSYQTEIVYCQQGASHLPLLCKYSGDPALDRAVRLLSHGQRGGVRYEADVYQHALVGLDVSTPVFRGRLELVDQDRICLVIGFVDEALRVTKVKPDVGVGQAARRLARFHADGERADRWTGLYRYDLDYFSQWPSLALQTVERLGLDLPWFGDLARRYKEAAGALLDSPTIVHGEFYPKNILAKDGAIVILDWETAAEGSGEIDLASLIEGWNPDVATHCIDEYRRTRWPGETPPGFRSRLEIAQAYWYFRWLARASGVRSAQSRVDSLNRIAELWGER